MQLEPLFPDWEPARREAHFYALRCVAHRLRKFGFEEIVNRMDPATQWLLSSMVHEPMATALRNNAATADPTLIARTIP